MNGRHNLYRMQHWQLAERQRYLADLEALAVRLLADVEALGREIDEAAAAKPGRSARGVSPLYVGALLERRDKLVRTVAEVDGQIVEAREAVSTTQQEMKVFEGTIAYRGFSFEERRVRRSRRSI